ncbi:MAG: ABC transporter permease [Anaerolineae bacterium]|nr:ABC transporter permease [Gemmatimonadaceae bacterium]
MNTLLHDLRLASRTLLRSRAFTLTAVLCLALGIGVNTAIFSIVNAILLRPLPLLDPQRIVQLHATKLKQGISESNMSFADMTDVRERSGSFEAVAGMYGRSFNLSGGDQPERIEGMAVSHNLFELIGSRPVLGRAFRPEEDMPGAERVVILGNGIWRRRFGGRANILGQAIQLNGAPYTVVGIMPDRFKFPETQEIWVPMALDASEDRGERYIWSIGRLKEGVTLAQGRSELATLAGRLAQQYPTNVGWELDAKLWQDEVVEGNTRLMLYLMLGAVGFVLLIACANVANLLLARATSREREVALRVALGASRGRIVRQLLTESMLIALAAGALGILIAVWWVDLMVASIPEEMPYWITFGVDKVGLLYTFLLSIATGLLFGILPALRASRPDLHASLKEGGRGASGGARSHRLRSALVMSQLALSVILLVGASLMVKSFLAMSRANAGFETARLLTMRTYLAGERYDGVPARSAFLEGIIERTQALPGVVRAVATTAIPTDDGGTGTSIVAEGRSIARGDETMVTFFGSTAGLFDVLGTPLLAGRPFTKQETADSSASVVIVNRALADLMWPGETAVGKRVHLGMTDTATWMTVVGVANDLHYEEFAEETAQSRLQVHVPYGRSAWRTMAIIIQTRGNPSSLVSAVRREIRAADPNLPTYDVRTMDDVRRYTLWPYRLYGQIFGAFAVIALVLASIGVYGVVAYAVSMRTREIGVRIALGAQTGDVVRMVVGQGVVLAVAGVAIGLVGALAVSRLLAGALYGISATDPSSFLLIPLMLAGVALLASYLPARRAARVDPVVALRSE